MIFICSRFLNEKGFVCFNKMVESMDFILSVNLSDVKKRERERVRERKRERKERERESYDETAFLIQEAASLHRV